VKLKNRGRFPNGSIMTRRDIKALRKYSQFSTYPSLLYAIQKFPIIFPEKMNFVIF
jgi:hypothetical protein